MTVALAALTPIRRNRLTNLRPLTNRLALWQETAKALLAKRIGLPTPLPGRWYL